MGDTSLVPATPALLIGTITHRRRDGVPHAFTHHYTSWLIDIDHPPRWGPLSRCLAHFAERDFLQGHTTGGSFGEGLRAQLSLVVQGHGLTLDPTDRVVMLAHPRHLGYAFNPLTMYWCFNTQDQQKWSVAEVHNTYGSRHLYVLHEPDTRVGKQMYVSPFHDVAGEYRIAHQLEDGHVSVHVSLKRKDRPSFTASVRGRLAPATPRSLLWVSLRHPLMTWRVAALIRLHGIYLFLRRLPLHPRPPRDKVRSSSSSKP